MSQSISEFIFFKVKPDVRPEDPASTEGRALLGVLQTTQHQSGHRNSVWGRVVEDDDVIIWAVGMFPLIPFPSTKCRLVVYSVCREDSSILYHCRIEVPELT